MDTTNTKEQVSPLTYGQKAVGITFNPSGNNKVNIIKTAYAHIIDNLDSMRDEGKSEKNRLISIAITEAQAAQMWAVKAVTWQN